MREPAQAAAEGDARPATGPERSSAPAHPGGHDVRSLARDSPFQLARDPRRAPSLRAGAGKYRLAHTPAEPFRHATPYVTARGLDTSPVPDGPGAIDLSSTPSTTRWWVAPPAVALARFPLGPGTVADFHQRALDLIRWLGGTPTLDRHPNEIPDAVPFPRTRCSVRTIPSRVERLFGALVQVQRVFEEFRPAFWASAARCTCSGELRPP
jgi:hypothetical protein